MSQATAAAECVISHVGICVSSIERSRKFYEEAFGFKFLDEAYAPDEVTAPLGGMEPPIGCKALFFRQGKFTLELLTFEHAGVNRPDRPRANNDIGLTHFSVGCDDIEATVMRVVEYGGSLIENSWVDGACMIRDPDGQKIELLGRAYAERTEPWDFSNS